MRDNMRKLCGISELILLICTAFLSGCGTKSEKAFEMNKRFVNEDGEFRVGLCLTGKEEAFMNVYSSELTAHLKSEGVIVVIGDREKLEEENVNMVIAAPLEEKEAEEMVLSMSETIPVLILNHLPSDDIALKNIEPERIYYAAYISYDALRIEEVLDELTFGGKRKYGKCMVVSPSDSAEDSLFLKAIESSCKNRGINSEEIFLYATERTVDSYLEADSEISHLFLERTDLLLDTAVSNIINIRDGKNELYPVLIEAAFVTREEYEKSNR